MAQRREWGGVATLWGLLFGALTIVLALLDRSIFSAARAGTRQSHGLLAGGAAARVALIVVGFVLLFLAGVIAARSTRRIEAGIVAGLLAGAVAGLAQLALTLLAVGGAARRGATGPAVRALEVGALGRSAALLVVAALVGAGLGALGGLAGRGRQPDPAASPFAPSPPAQGPAVPPPGYLPPPSFVPYPEPAAHAGQASPQTPGYGSLPDPPTLTPPIPPGA